MSNEYLDILNQTQAGTQPDPRQPVIDALQRFCDGINGYRPQALSCALELGFRTNYGQEYRVVLTSKRTGYQHTLLRAYLPLSASPIRLDLYDTSLEECQDVPHMERVLKDFLRRPETRSAIETLSK